MEQRGKLPKTDFECLALTIFSCTFGYTFLRASFGKELFDIDMVHYIKQSVALFIRGIEEGEIRD